MAFRGRKVYGSYKTVSCVFCGKLAMNKNERGLEVCAEHKERVMNNIKCTCGSLLEMRDGKFGTFFSCVNCGNISLRKALEMKQIME